ncbi:MAG: hypothetical protein CSA40_01395 [Flavobacteriales bacterium]|nr:MAG: hypothetical protein CSA40_01395 [Flavobacteriales bacterium]
MLKLYNHWMTTLLVLILGISLMSCGDHKPNDLLPDKDVNVVIDLSLPLYQDLLIPSGYAFTPITAEYGLQGIVIINKNSSTYAAFDRACPHLALNDCGAMTYDGLYLKCPCDGVQFNPLNGGTSTQVEFQAREYHVEVLGANKLRIRSY